MLEPAQAVIICSLARPAHLCLWKWYGDPKKIHSILVFIDSQSDKVVSNKK